MIEMHSKYDNMHKNEMFLLVRRRGTLTSQLAMKVNTTSVTVGRMNLARARQSRA